MALDELKQLPIWSPSFTKRGKAKAPYFDINDPSAHVTYPLAEQTQQLLSTEQSKYLGVMPTLDDPYIYLDVDVEPVKEGETKKSRKQAKIQPILLELLEQYPTYTEVSPSGNGLHIIYKLDARAYEVFKLAGFTRITASGQDVPFVGEIMFSSSFLILTENLFFPDKPEFSQISTISIDGLLKFAPALSRKLQLDLTPTAVNPESNVIGIKSRQRVKMAPDLQDLQRRLMLLPTRMDYYAQRAYEKLNMPMCPSTYDHWVNVCMCLCHSAIQAQDSSLHTEFYQLFDQWSQRDPDTYKGPEDTAQKWEQCLKTTIQRIQQDSGYAPALTKATLHKLVNLCYPQYPVVNDKFEPIWESHVNIQTALDFHGLIFLADIYSFDSLYAKCHRDVAERIFPSSFSREPDENPDYQIVHLKSIDLALRVVLEASGFLIPAIKACLPVARPLAGMNINFDLNINVYDKFQTWIDSVPWDGTPRVQQVINTLKFNELEDPMILNHYRHGLYKCLLWLVAIRYYGKPSAPPCVPILVGSEGIYKSTWCKALLHDTPFAMQYVKSISGLLKERKELTRALQSTLIALIDEIETSMTNADKAKDILSEEQLSIRAHYQNGYVNVIKRGLIFGTTNNPYIQASDDGNRRYLRITVRFCDTSELWTINMQQVYAELKQDYLNFVKQGNNMPWVFTKEENALNNLIMGEASTASNDTLLFEEYFGGRPENFEFDPKQLLGKQGGLKQNVVLEEEGLAVSVKSMANKLVEYQQLQNFNMAIRAPNRAVVRRKLQSFAAKYTKSEHCTVMIGTVPCTNGAIKAKGQTLFVIPKRRTNHD